MNTHTLRKRMDRENRVRDYLTKGWSSHTIARELGQSQQSLHRYLQRRGWKTAAVARTEDMLKEIRANQDLTDAEIGMLIGRTEAFVKNLRSQAQ